jgi:hypothetical protein
MYFRRKTKFIAIKYHYVNELMDEGWIEIESVKSDESTLDLFPKSLEVSYTLTI